MDLRVCSLIIILTAGCSSAPAQPAPTGCETSGAFVTTLHAGVLVNIPPACMSAPSSVAFAVSYSTEDGGATVNTSACAAECVLGPGIAMKAPCVPAQDVGCEVAIVCPDMLVTLENSRTEAFVQGGCEYGERR